MLQIFASLGKRRASRNEQLTALDPLLRSIELFNRLANAEDNSSSYNISVRWSVVAGIFQSIGWTGAASLATVMTITSGFTSVHCTNQVVPKDKIFNDIMSSLGSSTHGIIETGCEVFAGSDNNRMCIRRLVENLLQNGGQASPKCKSLSTERVIELLLNVASEASTQEEEGSILLRLIPNHAGDAVSIVSLLRATCENDTKENHVDWVTLLMSILEISGKSMQRASESPSKEALASYEEVTDFLVELLHYISDEMDENVVEDSESILCSTALIAASTSLIVESPIFNNISLGTPIEIDGNPGDHSPLLVPLALKLARQACDVIGHEKRCRNNHNQLLSAVRSTAMLYLRNLLNIVEDASLVNTNEATLTIVDEGTLATFSSNENASVASKSARACMSWTLGRLRDRLSFQGDRLHASQVAIWQAVLLTDLDGICKQWANSLATNVLLTSGLLDVAFASQHSQDPAAPDESKLFLNGSDIESDGLACWQALVSTEKQVVNLRLKLSSGRTTETASIELQLQEKLKHAEVIQSESNSGIIVAVMSWIRASILFVLSEADEVAGNIQQAIYRVRQSFQACKEVIASEDILKSRALLSSSGSFTRMIPPSLIIQSFEKLIECLQRTAILYARLGDHRRSSAYAFSALKSCNNPDILAELTPKLKVIDLLSLFRGVESSSLLEESCRRQMIWLRALSSTSTLVAGEFLNLAQEDRTLASSGRTIQKLTIAGSQRLSELEDDFIGKCQ